MLTLEGLDGSSVGVDAQGGKKGLNLQMKHQEEGAPLAAKGKDTPKEKNRRKEERGVKEGQRVLIGENGGNYSNGNLFQHTVVVRITNPTI